MRTAAAIAFAAIAAGVGGSVTAQVAGEIAFEEARVLAGACFGCHGPEGIAPPGPIPTIAGMPAEAMIAMMADFRDDLVPGATVMGRIAFGYTDAEIAAIARYFAGGWGTE